MQLLDSASQRDRVRRHIVEPLKGRGAPPRGWTEEAMFADYVLALGKYPDDVLAEAAARMRASHTKTTWPLAGEYREICEKIAGPASNDGSKDPDAERVKRSVAAHDYAARRLQADDGKLFLRAVRGGWDRDVRAFLFERACACLRAGDDPYVSNDELEAEVLVWERNAAARRQSRAGIGAGAPKSTRAPPPMRKNLPPNFETEMAVQRAKADAGPPPVDLDEDIPPPASEADYGAAAP